MPASSFTRPSASLTETGTFLLRGVTASARAWSSSICDSGSLRCACFMPITSGSWEMVMVAVGLAVTVSCSFCLATARTRSGLSPCALRASCVRSGSRSSGAALYTAREIATNESSGSVAASSRASSLLEVNHERADVSHAEAVDSNTCACAATSSTELGWRRSTSYTSRRKSRPRVRSA